MADWEKVQNWSKQQARRYQFRQLTDFLQHVVQPNSPFYQTRFEKTGFDPHSLRTLDDLQDLPLTTKEDLLPTEDHPEQHRKFILQPDESELKSRWSVRFKALLQGKQSVKREIEREFRPIFLTATTGRSSSPVAFLYTDHDMNNLRRAGKRLVEVMDGDPSDRGANLFPYAPHLAFWQVVFAALEFGMLVISSGGGKVRGTEGNLDLIERLQPEYIMGIPSYVYHAVREAVNAGQDLSHLQGIVLGGEAISPGGRENLIELTREGGADSPDILPTYAFTEARMAWAECPSTPEDPSGYHYYPDMSLFELRDPETGNIVPHDEGGELVYTPLDARGSVVLRYRTGDLCRSIEWGECPHCGRTLPRIMGPIERVSKIEGLKLDKVKGTLINFNDLQRMLDEHPMLEEWQVELRKRDDDPMGLDEFHLHINPKPGVDRKDVEERLSRDVEKNAEVRPNQIHFHEYDVMLDRLGLEDKLKEERFVDNRPEHDE